MKVNLESYWSRKHNAEAFVFTVDGVSHRLNLSRRDLEDAIELFEQALEAN